MIQIQIIVTGMIALIVALAAFEMAERKAKADAAKRLAWSAEEKPQANPYELYSVDRLLANRSDRWD